jgi:hypothetical protein
MNRSGAILCILIIFVPGAAFSANVSVPELELLIHGFLDDGVFQLNTMGKMDVAIEGGYKFGGRVVIGFENDDLVSRREHLPDDGTTGVSDIVSYLLLQPSLVFKSAAVTIRELFSIPLDLSVFTGQHTIFCNGDIFPSYFGTYPVASRFGSYVYFPDSIVYDGIHTVTGTGLEISTTFGSEKAKTAIFVYQDAYLGPGIFSADLHTMVNLDFFKMEGFIGASFPASDYGFYRAGFLFFFKAGDVGEFLTQIGIPKYDPANDKFAIDLFYFLFEPRIKIRFFNIHMTLFWHPAFYREYLLTSTGELGSIDINLNLLFAEPEKSPFSGGLEGTFSFDTKDIDQFDIKVSPYFRAVTAGVMWDFRLNVRLFPFELSEMFEGFIGITAEF